MATEAQRERERALLALRRVGAALHPADEQAPLVAVRADQRDAPVDLGLAVRRERVEQRGLQVAVEAAVEPVGAHSAS